MTSRKDSTEEKILNSAQAVFVNKGMDGTRMQEIADRAGINKALLHYYFRSKRKLFEAIFRNVFKQIIPNLEALISSESPFEVRLSLFIESYIDVLIKNPVLPSFILREINRDPEFLASVIRSQGLKPSRILNMLEAEMDRGRIRKMDPREIMINLLGLSVFPFAARPLMTIVFFDNDKAAYRDFLENRKQTVKEFVLHSILIQ